jgi:hypothetical protein
LTVECSDKDSIACHHAANRVSHRSRDGEPGPTRCGPLDASVDAAGTRSRSLILIRAPFNMSAHIRRSARQPDGHLKRIARITAETQTADKVALLLRL